ncbi:membrane protein [Flavobacterium noncentrifugens]|uniref:Starch-binding associating with outer membrane n=1 Tax=Flavobacterium noncentrifugens TaxID=1128970 RepID=A0A1G8YHL2_9FLAO|nr:RagB/SusD family nutrient uptake outer membrane protein [Flavobacterium noncentrifugens]GEP51231.1 membrane protein [Flavobacterium noncentrifugens]SDK02369.1 Starch-binding associating with outer membrane [Flavobacterium noncentrifugens]
MKKYIFKTVAFAAVFGLISISCSDDFVDREAPYTIGSENYFNSEAEYNQALIGAYDLLHASYVNVLLGEIASDNTASGGGSATDVIGFQQIDDMTHTPVNPNLKNIWDWMFAGVQRANYILEFKDKTDFPNKNQVIGETRFLRAYFQFELVKWFGPIPMKGDKRFLPIDVTLIPRSPVNDVYTSIEADLQFAVDNLSPNAEQTGRATKGAAQALLGKVYLYHEKFAESAAVFEDLIGSGKYSLVADYGSIFENLGENGPESVFEIQYSEAQGASFDCLQCSEGNVAVGFSGIRNYSGPMFSSGYSFNVPQQEVVDAFEPGDKRKDVAILDIVAWAAANNATYGVGYKHTGFFNKKYLPRTRTTDAPGDVNLTNPNNYRAIRYADVLLMAAEANSRGGISDAKAREYLNQVRRRAFGDNSHDITASGQPLINSIWTERRVELVGEGHRFFDLVRTGKGTEIDGFVTGKNELFPVPIEEIQFANGNWKQNPGY